jgi:thioredoxin-like negative regulator of GroEL
MIRFIIFIFAVIIAFPCFAQSSRLQEANNKLNRRNFEGALQDFNQILIENPQNVEALCGRAEAKIALADCTEGCRIGY